MAFSVRSNEAAPGVQIVSVAGTLDSDNYQTFEKTLGDVLNKNPLKIILDMEQLQYISSLGLRVILKTRKEIMRCKGSIALYNLQPQVRKIFEVTNNMLLMEQLHNRAELDAHIAALKTTQPENP
jgi:anti-sigma B factor antagonist